MEVRPDTLSGSFGGQWSFLHHTSHDAQTRSLPPSSYIRSDRSSISPLQTSPYQASGSRSSLSRGLPSASTGARSTTTIPSQPVLLRVHSADASAHLQPTPRLSRRPIKMSKQSELPAIEEFSIEGILNSIQEDVEADMNTIAEILGRSRLVLADQHDSHMPPQGEITGNGHTLQAVEEASVSSEQLAADHVLIMRDDASLANDSNSGSAAYGLLERLQALPRSQILNSDIPEARPLATDPAPIRHHSSPAALLQTEESTLLAPEREANRSNVVVREAATEHIASRGPSQAVVSEIYLSAEANGASPDTVPIVSESGRHYALYSLDDSGILDTQTRLANDDLSPNMRRRFQSLFPGELSGLSTWISGRTSAETAQNAEARLRELLNR